MTEKQGQSLIDLMFFEQADNIVEMHDKGESAVARRKSNRTTKLTDKARENKYQDLHRKLDTTVKQCIKLHINVEKQLKEHCTADVISSLISELNSALPPVLLLHDEIKALGYACDSSMTCKIDKLTRDNHLLTSNAQQTLASVSENNKCPSKPSSKCSSVSLRSSNKTTSTRASEKLRMQASLIAAKAAAKKVELQARMEMDELQFKIDQLSKEKERRRIRCELEAEEKKIEVLMKAAEAEDAERASNKSVLMLDHDEDGMDEVVEELEACKVHEKTTLTPKPMSYSTPVDKSHELLDVSQPDADELRRIRTYATAFSMGAKDLLTEPDIFHGDPLKYFEWSSTFDNYVDGRGLTRKDKLHKLKKYIAGEAKEAITYCFYLDSDEVYDEARGILKSRFGDPYIVAERFIQKLTSWPKIQGKDAIGLRKFSDFLRQCAAAMTALPDLKCLDMKSEIKQLASKLPDWLSNRWVRVEGDRRKRQLGYPGFKEFSDFVLDEAQVIVDHQQLTARTSTNPPSGSSKSAYVQKAKCFNTQSRPTAIPDKRVAKCYVCDDTKHKAYTCPKLEVLDLKNRKELVTRKGLCTGCLGKYHSVKDCKRRATCKKCSGEHPSILHYDKEDQSKMTPSLETATSHCVSCDIDDNVSSMIVPVKVKTSNSSDAILTYAMLDTQSDATFILDTLCEQLKADYVDVRLNLDTMIEKGTVMVKKVQDLKVSPMSGETWIDLPPAYSRPVIPVNPRHIPTPDKVKGWAHLSDLATELHDKLDIEVGLLIGYNCPQALAPREVISVEGPAPYAIKTDLGWSVVGSGSLIGKKSSEHALSHRIMTKDIEPATSVHQQVTYEASYGVKELISLFERNFYEDHDKHALSIEDTKFLSILSSGVHTNQDGYITMPLPLRMMVPENKSLKTAQKRFELLLRKFKMDSGYKKQYVDFIQDILDKNEAEVVPDQELEKSEAWYIPHFGVFHPKKPGKIRVVFDCSAKSADGVCLNDFLYPGPDLANTLVGILLRFRKEPVAMICDIERMFHQFHVNPNHTDLLRFLWLNEKEETVVCRMKVHLFGACHSPSTATFGLRYAAQKSANSKEKGKEFIMNNFYVDDGLISTATVAEALDIYKESTEICKDVNIRLHKFISSSREVMDAIPETEKAAKAVCLDLNKDVNVVERALGIEWSVDSDMLQFCVQPKDRPFTRRGVLSIVSTVFDPLGLVSPFVLKGKALLQEMCRVNSAWDDPLDEALLPRWRAWLEDLNRLPQLQINRCVKPPDFGKVTKVELHHFCDASTIGYGVCSYLKQTNTEGKQTCRLIMAKSRVAPLKVVSIPRLELQAAVLSATLSTILKDELKMQIDEEHFWCDSKVVLGYIKNETSRYHVYVGNRVQKIRDRSLPEQWHHIATEINPADACSRGCSVKELIESDWLIGPEMLRSNTVIIDTETYELSDEDPEVKHPCIVHATSSMEPKSEEKYDTMMIIGITEKFSVWTTLVKAITLLKQRLRFKTGKPPLPDVEAMLLTETLLVKAYQEEYFKEELEHLKVHKIVNAKSPLAKLDPFLDDKGILRLGGRSKLSKELTFEEKHPVILPPRTHLNTLLIRHHHNLVHHQGKGMTLAKIRNSGYWIIGGSRQVSQAIYHCTLCRKLRATPSVPKMAELPEERLKQSAPFTYVGADCFGPFYVKDGRKEVKRYGLLFTCLYTRAVHLEVLEDMTTDEFILSLRNLISIRGPIRLLQTDNGSNFVGANAELRKMLLNMKDTKLKSYLIQNKVLFKTNPPYASNMGGVWERLIRSVRSVLARILKEQGNRLNTAGLRSFMYEAMAIINSRPLTTSDNLDVPLSPNLLLTMKTDVIPPLPGDIDPSDVYSRKRWLKVQALANLFWQRWKAEYLTEIQVRQKWLKNSGHQMKTGDLVIVKDDSTYRTEWPLGQIVKLIPSSDNISRKAEVVLGTKDLDLFGKRSGDLKTIIRPFSKLIPLSV